MFSIPTKILLYIAKKSADNIDLGSPIVQENIKFAFQLAKELIKPF